MTRLETALQAVQGAIEQQVGVVKWLKEFRAELPKSTPKKIVKKLDDLLVYLQHNL